MVVSEEDNPNNTTTFETEKGILNSSELNYYSIDNEKNEDKIEKAEEIFDNNNYLITKENIVDNNIMFNEEKKIEIDFKEANILFENSEYNEVNNETLSFKSLEEDKILDEPISEAMNIYSPKSVEIPFENNIETGLEILYTSMKLKDFPIKESNLPYHEESIENISLNSSNIHIGDITLSNVNIRILGYNKFKLIEFKTREFKIALSIALFDGNTIRKQEDYFTYEIFSKLKNSRICAVAEILKALFSGEKITFQIKDLFGEIQFENPIQHHKFNMIIESINKYDEVMKLMNITKVKNFSESSLQFYTLHLLHSYLNNTSILNSWINFRINNKFNINIGDKISFTKIHDLNIRGFNYNLKETAIVKSALTEKEVNLEKNIVSGYRKTVDIKLELVEKQF